MLTSHVIKFTFSTCLVGFAMLHQICSLVLSVTSTDYDKVCLTVTIQHFPVSASSLQVPHLLKIATCNVLPVKPSNSSWFQSNQNSLRTVLSPWSQCILKYSCDYSHHKLDDWLLLLMEQVSLQKYGKWCCRPWENSKGCEQIVTDHCRVVLVCQAL